MRRVIKMPTNQIIREKRKEIGFTQEQVAEYLGVSAPAVNRWESGATYPDISLLPALARLLKTDLNTLLCFNDGLSEQEVSHFCKEIVDAIQSSGFKSGYSIAVKKIQEYPSCAALIYYSALVLDGAMMMSEMSIEEKEKYSISIMSFYERTAKCDDEKIRNNAAFMLASKYMKHEQYAKAQEMLDSMPERSALDKKRLQANLWIGQGKLAEAAQLLERELLLPEINEIQTTVICLADIALKEGYEEHAMRLSEVSREAAKLFDLWGYYSFIAPLQVAVAQKNVSESISLLNSILGAALSPWNANHSSLYRHIADKMHHENIGLKMLPGLLSEIENDPKYAFLRSNAEFQQMIAQYHAMC